MYLVGHRNEWNNGLTQKPQSLHQNAFSICPILLEFSRCLKCRKKGSAKNVFELCSCAGYYLNFQKFRMMFSRKSIQTFFGYISYPILLWFSPACHSFPGPQQIETDCEESPQAVVRVTSAHTSATPNANPLLPF